MKFASEEDGQLGPFEELYTLIVIVALIFIFASTVARTYLEHETRIEPIERFSAGLDFVWSIKTSLLTAHVNGVPNPGLTSDSVLIERGNFIYLNQFWSKPYDWEVLVRDANGLVLYEFGSLNTDSNDPRSPMVRVNESLDLGSGLTVVYSPLALRRTDGATEMVRMEVWVW